MIISDLQCYEVLTDVENLTEVKGAAALLGVSLSFLSLGQKNSVAEVQKANFLTVSAPKTNISSGELVVVLGAN